MTWRDQLRRSIRTLEQLEAVVELTDDEREAVRTLGSRFRLGITPYYASLMGGPDCPVRRQAIPTLAEAVLVPGETSDPLAEDAHVVAPGLTRRYPDRALLFVSPTCAVYCRHCTRR
ncbi:MAG: lysine 2,3-aminomutase, partial [Myxococcales bacterium]|nr:lysine 2,3-aminomutase [Myxococcales bacterium]